MKKGALLEGFCYEGVGLVGRVERRGRCLLGGSPGGRVRGTWSLGAG